MRNKTSVFKRSLAALLSFVMILGMFPVLGGSKIALEAEAAPAEGTNYITLPITIRDFAADGMLFEWNEVNKKGTTTVGGESIVGYPIKENPTSWDLGAGDHTGFRLYDPDNLTFDTSLGYTGYRWHCVIVDTSNGNIVKVLAKDEVKTDTYDTYMQDGYISIWVWEYDIANYEVLSKITEANKNLYRIDFVNADMYIGYAFTKNTWGDYTGIRYFDTSGDPFANNYNAETTHCLICDSNGNVVKVLGTGEEKAETYNSLMQEGYFALFAWTANNNAAARDALSAITDENKSEYKVSFLTDTWYETELLYLLAVGDAEIYHMADTQGFTFLQTDANDYSNIMSSAEGAANPIAGTDRTQLGAWNSAPGTATGDPVPMTLNSTAQQTLLGGWIRTNLVEAELDDDNKPVYTAATVEYLAGYMDDVMSVDWQNADGSYNTYHVEGVKLFDANWRYVPEGDPTPKVYDLADFIRHKIKENGRDDDMGTYTESDNKFKGKIEGKQLDTANDIETWCDAAYYLLHYYWRDSQYESRGGAGSDGYGMNIPKYTSLHLVEKVVDGQTYYVFNSGYDDTKYSYETGEIWNTQTDEMTTDTNTPYVYGNPLTTNRFDPLGPSGTEGGEYGYGMSGDTYGNMTPGADVNAFYSNTNYNLSLEGHAEFVYHYASDLYFTFTGDDDVYLYINGIRVLDVGAAHSIAKVKISLNDIATTCGLKEGEPARFDFFYLERHGSAANFGIETNIQLAESGMITTKNGYQNGTTTGYDGPVNPDNPVAYSFTLKNAGDATLEDLTFKDDKLGVFLSWYEIDWGNKIEGVDADGKPVDGGPIKNMYLYVRDENDNIVRFYSAATTPALTEELLRNQLDMGLMKGQSMTIYNLRYQISDEDWQEGDNTFTNIVNTTAVANNKPVAGTADWKVHKQELNAEPIHIYNWVNKDLDDTDWQSREEKLTKAELVQPVVDAGKTVPNNADIVLCNSAGQENSALWSEAYTNVIANVTHDNDDSITYNSKTPGMVTIYYKIENIGYDDYVFHFDVITYGVADNVYVLDYGLNVELNKEYGFRENDHLSVPQNINEKNLTWTMNVHQDEHQWGEFVANGTGLKLTDSVEYRPKDIIDGCDSITVTIQLRESDADTTRPLKFYGVDMDQNVSTAPANVVYYEENHPGITYVEVGENNWIRYETMAPVMVQDTDENGDPIFKPAVDEDGNPIYQQKVDIYGEPVFDENDDPIYQEEVDKNGDPVLDEEGNPVYVQVMVPVMVPKRDEQGNIIYESVAGTNQSADQDSNYGSDPNYGEDKIGWNDENAKETIFELDTKQNPNVWHQQAVNALNEYLGLTDEDSNGTVTKLVVKEAAEVMWFDFVGTGFEIVSRTTQDQYAVINVKVYLVDNNGNIVINQVGTEGYKEELPATNKNGMVRMLPVVTESMGGTIYQVPIISITGMQKAHYCVRVEAGYHEELDSVLYIDGIRIYGPLGDEALEYYNPEEYQAAFYEVKDLIANNQAIFADVTDTNGIPHMGTGCTMIENIDYGETDASEYALINSILTGEYDEDGVAIKRDVTFTDYLKIGPNNEIYLDGNSTSSMIAFFVTPDEDVPETQRTIQIGAHRKADSFEGYDANVPMFYGNDPDKLTAADVYDQPYCYSVASGTEQYFDIDIKYLGEPDAYGRYLVMIVAGESDGLTEILALTSLKVKGYNISYNQAQLTADYKAGTLGKNPLVAGPFSVLKASLAGNKEEPEVETVRVNENLNVTSAALRATSVASGKTATLTVKAGSEAQTVVVTDEAGNEVAYSRCTSKVSGDTVTFSFLWKPTGNRGEKQTFTIRVYDVNGLASVNTKTVTVTIK